MKRPNHHQYTTLSQPQPTAADEGRKRMISVGSGDQSEASTISARSASPLQKSFSLDLEAITSTSARNQTMFTITRAGTYHSRNGLYVRPSWQEVLRSYINRKTAVIAFVILIICSRSIHSLFVKSSSLSQSKYDSSDIHSPHGKVAGGDGNDPHGKAESASDSSSYLPVSGNGILASIAHGGDTINLSAQRAFSKLKTYCRDNNSIGEDRKSSPPSCSETCANTLTPAEGRDRGKNWYRAYEMNQQLIAENYGEKLDIVFFGDSITEEWNGRCLGKSYKDPDSYIDKALDDATQSFANIQSVFRKYFDKKSMKGLALGIAGDTIPQLLYRIQNEELARGGLDSKVFWLLIGTNDLSLGCSEEAIFLGIVRAVEEIRKIKPDSIVVLNGILPRSGRPDGRLVTALPFDSSSGTGSDRNRSRRIERRARFDDDFFEDNSAHTPNAKGGNVTKDAAGPSTSPPETEIDLDLDYWDAIMQINRGLEKYARDHDKVEYFDASDVFVARLGNKYFQRQEAFVMKELMSDFLHPTALGHELWAEKIVDYIISDLDTPFNLL